MTGPDGVTTPPCGACRQVLAEFGRRTLRCRLRARRRRLDRHDAGRTAARRVRSRRARSGARSRLIERTYTTDAIVLRARNLGEADKIFTLFTRSSGKVDAVGKGVRRPKSTLGGRLELLTESTLTLHRGRSLDIITSAVDRCVPIGPA